MALLPSDRLRHTARGIVVHDGQILLMERWRDGLHYFSIPGGKIEDNESAPDALEREMLEETTVIVEVEDLVLQMNDKDVEHYIYSCKYVSGQPHLAAHAPEREMMDSNNRFEPCWQPIEALESISLMYWEPLRVPLIEGLKNGFKTKPTIVTADSTR